MILAGLIPLTVLGLIKAGGVSGLFDKVRRSALGEGGTALPGMIAPVLFGDLGIGRDHNDAIPLLMRDLLPNGVLGVAVTGLPASFMAGMAADISGVGTVFTNDIWQAHVRPDRPDGHYLNVGRIATVAGVALGVGTAFIAAG